MRGCTNFEQVLLFHFLEGLLSYCSTGDLLWHRRVSI